MQWLASVSVRRAVFATVLMLAVLVVGVGGYQSFGVDPFPKIDFPVVSVTTRLDGAAPEEVETELTDKIEEAVNTISGIDELRSTSTEGVCLIFITFTLDKHARRRRAGRARPRHHGRCRSCPRASIRRSSPRSTPTPPPSSTSPCRPTPPSATPPSSPTSASAAIWRASPASARCSSSAAASGRSTSGSTPEAMRAHGITAGDVPARHRRARTSRPRAATCETGPRELTLRVQGRVDTPVELGRIVVSQSGDHPMRLADVARVEDGEEELQTAAMLDGKHTVVLSLRKQSGENTVAVVDAVRAQAWPTSSRRSPRACTLEVVRDSSGTIQTQVNAVKEHLVLGALFAALVVLLFLGNFRSTIIAALAIPISIVGTFALMWAMGFTLNIITLLALALAVGIVIDDAIVVLENIVRFIHEKKQQALPGGDPGHPRHRPGGARHHPLAHGGVSPGGLHERHRRPLPAELRPDHGLRHRGLAAGELHAHAHARRALAEPGPRQGRGGREVVPGAAGRRLLPAHRAHLHGDAALGHGPPLGHRPGLLRRARISASLSGKRCPRASPRINDEADFEINLRAPEGTSLPSTLLIAERVARETRRMPGVHHTLVTIGDGNDLTANKAGIYVQLVDPKDRSQSQQEIVDRVRREILAVMPVDLRIDVSDVDAFNSGQSTKAVQYVINGPDIEKLGRLGESVAVKLRRVKGTADVDTDVVLGKPEVHVHVERDKAADLGVQIAAVSNAIQLLVGGLKVSTYEENGEDYDVRVRAGAGDRTQVARLGLLTVPSTKLGTVSLRDLVNVGDSTGPSQINRLNRRRQVTISANVKPGFGESDIQSALETIIKEEDLPPGYNALPIGRTKETGRAAKAFGIAFVLTLSFMYLVLAAQFESWVHPSASWSRCR